MKNEKLVPTNNPKPVDYPVVFIRQNGVWVPFNEKEIMKAGKYQKAFLKSLNERLKAEHNLTPIEDPHGYIEGFKTLLKVLGALLLVAIGVVVILIVGNHG